MRRYSLSRAFLVFATVISALVTVAAVWGIALLLRQKDAGVVGILLIVAVLLGCILIMINLFRLRVTVSKDSIHKRSLFTDRKLNFDEIAGFTTSTYRSRTTLNLVHRNETMRGVSISSAMNGYEDIAAWAAAIYPDLDELAKKAALEDPALGNTPEEVAGRLLTARKICGALTIVAICLLIASLFHDLWKYAIVLAMVLPLAAIALVRRYYRFIGLGMGKDIPFPSIFYSLIISACMLAYYALSRMHLVSQAGMCLPAVVIGLGLLALLLWGVGKTDFLSVFLAILIAIPYGYGAATFVNAFGDGSVPQEHTVVVLNKWHSEGKAYYLQLEAWGPKPAGQRERVQGDLYNSVEKGSMVNISLHKGCLNIPWYTISRAF